MSDIAPAFLETRERRELLGIAERAIGHVLATGNVGPLDASMLSGALLEPGAAFVTLLRDDDLLGCVGTLQANEALAHAVHRAALQAAFADPRLPQVTAEDFAVMTIKISVLSPLEPLATRSYEQLLGAVRPRIDGIAVESGRRRATLLPSVWEQCGEAREFLAALWAKAGLAAGTWPYGLRVDRYTTEEFSAQ